MHPCVLPTEPFLTLRRSIRVNMHAAETHRRILYLRDKGDTSTSFDNLVLPLRLGKRVASDTDRNTTRASVLAIRGIDHEVAKVLTELIGIAVIAMELLQTEQVVLGTAHSDVLQLGAILPLGARGCSRTPSACST